MLRGLDYVQSIVNPPRPKCPPRHLVRVASYAEALANMVTDTTCLTPQRAHCQVTLETIAKMLRDNSFVGALTCWEMHKTLAMDLCELLNDESACVSVLMEKIDACFGKTSETSESEITPRRIKKIRV